MKLLSASPTFVVADVDSTMEWYVRELGFTTHPFPEKPPHVFAILDRDGVEIMLMKVAGYRKPDLTPLRPGGMWDAYIRMDGVEKLYTLLKDRPYLHSPLVNRPYQCTEFEIRDPNGYILVFSS